MLAVNFPTPCQTQQDRRFRRLELPSIIQRFWCQAVVTWDLDLAANRRQALFRISAIADTAGDADPVDFFLCGVTIAECGCFFDTSTAGAATAD